MSYRQPGTLFFNDPAQAVLGAIISSLATVSACVPNNNAIPASTGSSSRHVGDSAFLRKIADGPPVQSDSAISFPTQHSLVIDDGTYVFSVAFDEWGGKSLGTTCTVIINRDSVRVLHDGTGNLSGNKGDVLEAGVLMKHKRTGKWIIGHRAEDVNAKEIGGCGEGPTIIDLRRRIFWTC